LGVGKRLLNAGSNRKLIEANEKEMTVAFCTIVNFGISKNVSL